jgi:ribosomal protein S4
MARTYHGEQIREGTWEQMFSPRVSSVVPMDHHYLAHNDGSEQASGRGQGLDIVSKDGPVKKRTPPTPYMSMAFAPIERRLDTAIFRAMFTSSARQARQFVIHGFVKVNGKPMRHPGYLLNPGDMFSVDPERVLFATGAPKSKSAVGAVEGEEAVGEKASSTEEVEVKSADEDVALEGEELFDIESTEKLLSEAEADSPAKAVLESATSLVKSTDVSELPAKRKRLIRQISRLTKSLLPKISTISDDDLSELKELIAQFQASQEVTGEAEASSKTTKDAGDNGGIDPSKPYATPWRPRDYMAPFAFIPRYLEVNQNICSAVYLRHPVARPGMAEVSILFSLFLQSLFCLLTLDGILTCHE